MENNVELLKNIIAKALVIGLCGVLVILIFLATYSAFFPPYFDFSREIETKWLEFIVVSYMAGIFLYLYARAIIIVAVRESTEKID